MKRLSAHVKTPAAAPGGYGAGRLEINAPTWLPGRAGPPRNRVRLFCFGLLLTILFGVEAPASALPPAPVVLALGDSLTAGFGLKPDEALPAQLQAALAARGIEVRIVNGGVSGDTTAGGLARLDWALADRPQYALVELGANDALRGLDPEKAYANLDRIVTRLQSAGVKVLILGMRAPANWSVRYNREFDAIYPRLAEAHHVPLYPFLLDGMALDPRYTQADGLHPNAAGVKLIVGRLLPSVERLLGQGA